MDFHGGGEHISLTRDVFGDAGVTDVQLLLPSSGSNNPQGVVITSTTQLNASNAVGQNVLVSFIGQRGVYDPNKTPFRVGPPTAMMFNDVLCTMIPPVSSTSPQPGVTTPPLPPPTSPPAQPSAGEASAAYVTTAVPLIASPPTVLKVQYMPIMYSNDASGPSLFASSYTQMYLKISNPADPAPVPLEDVSLQYWFDGPDPAAVLASFSSSSGAPPAVAEQFKLVCSDTSPGLVGGCGALIGNFSVGLTNVRGARYLLTLQFAQGSGTLAPALAVAADAAALAAAVLHNNSTDAVPMVHSMADNSTSDPGGNSSSSSSGNLTGNGSTSGRNSTYLSMLELIVSIEPRQYFSQMNSTLDYSFMDNPLANKTVTSSIDPQSKVTLRKRLPNPYIPLFLNGTLVWGSPPTVSQPPPLAPSDAAAVAAASGAKKAPNPSPPSGSSSYPLGSSCQTDSTGAQICGVSVAYCCPAPVPVTAPADARTLAQSALGAYASSLSGGELVNVTGNSTGATMTATGASAGGSSGGSSGGSGRRSTLIAGVAGGIAGAGALIIITALALNVCFGRRHRALHARLAAAESLQNFPKRRKRRSLHDSSNSVTGCGSLARRLECCWCCGADDGRGDAWEEEASDAAALERMIGSDGLPLLTEQDYKWLDTSSAFARLRLKYATSPAGAGPPPLLLSRLNEQDFAQRGWGVVSGAGTLSDADSRALQHKGSSGSGPAAAGEEVVEVDDDIRLRILSHKFQTWTGRILDSWEPIPLYLHTPEVERRLTGGPPLATATTTSPDASRHHYYAGPACVWYGNGLGGDLHPALGASSHLASRMMKGGMGVWRGGGDGSGAPIPMDIDYKPACLRFLLQAEIEPNLGRLIGAGGFGRVYECVWKGRRVAVKCVTTCDTEAQYQSLVKEVAVTSRFRHCSYVVNLLGASLGDRQHLALIMDLAEGGNLSERIHSIRKRRLGYLEVLQVSRDIAAGLAYLHPGVIHRDLKPQNVLLDKDGRAKIADFGISRFKDPYKSFVSVTQQGGTPNYMAPELFNGTRVDEKCDVFSLGCIMYEAMTRKVPFEELGQENFNMGLFQIILAVAIHAQRPHLPDDMPAPMRALIIACWDHTPKKRPTVPEVLFSLESLIREEVDGRSAQIAALRKRSHSSRLGASGSIGSRVGSSGNLVAAANPPPTPALVSPFLIQQPSVSRQGSSSFPQERPAPSPAPTGETEACPSGPSPVRSLDINLPVGGIPAHNPAAKLALAEYMGEWDSTMSAAGAGAAAAAVSEPGAGSPFRQGARGSARSQNTSDAGQGAGFGGAGSASGFGSGSLGGSFWGGNSYTSTLPDTDDSPAGGPPAVTHVDSRQAVGGGGGGSSSSSGFGSRGVIGIAMGGGGGAAAAETSPGAGGSRGDVPGSSPPACDHSSTPGPSVAHSAGNSSMAHSAASSVAHSVGNSSVAHSAADSAAHSVGNSSGDAGAGQQVHARSRTCTTPGGISAAVSRPASSLPLLLLREDAHPAAPHPRQPPHPASVPATAPTARGRSRPRRSHQPQQHHPPPLTPTPTPTPSSTPARAYGEPTKRHERSSSSSGSSGHSASSPLGPLLASPSLFSHGASPSSPAGASQPPGRRPPSTPDDGAAEPPASLLAQTSCGSRLADTRDPAHPPSASRQQLGAAQSTEDPSVGRSFLAAGEPGYRYPMHPASRGGSPPQPGDQQAHHHTSSTPPRPASAVTAFDNMLFAPTHTADASSSSSGSGSSSSTAHPAPRSAAHPASAQPQTRAAASSLPPSHPSYTSGDVATNGGLTPHPPHPSSSSGSGSAPSPRPAAPSSHPTPAPFVALHVNDPPTSAQRELRFTACGNETHPSSSGLPHRASPPVAVGVDPQAPTARSERPGLGPSTDPHPPTVGRRHTLGQALKEDMEGTGELAGAASTAGGGSGTGMDSGPAALAHRRRSASHPGGGAAAPAAAPPTVLPWPASYAEQLLRRGLGSLWGGSPGGARS
ncbi:MAG: hypothetical protein WDW36_004954 [Sanguina aurantia]